MRRSALALTVLALGGAGLGCRKEAAPVQVSAAGNALEGTVLERLDAAPYTYLRLKTAQGEVWTAVPATDLQPGAQAKVLDAMPMEKWESPQLQRTFDRVYLGQLEGQGAAAPAMPPAHGTPSADADPHGPMGAGHPALGPTSVTDVKVPKASGKEARTVSEIWVQAQQLTGKEVMVQGTVVRVSTGLRVPGATGGTWIHIQDGSGQPQRGDNDLTVATNDTPKVGDVVVVKGIVQPNPMGDGSGMMLHQATVTPGRKK